MGERKKKMISLNLEEWELESINQYCLKNRIDRNTFIRLSLNLALSIFKEDLPKTFSIDGPLDMEKGEVGEGASYPDDGKVHASEQWFYDQVLYFINQFQRDMARYSFKEDVEKSDSQDFRMTKRQQKEFVGKLDQIKALLAQK